MLKQGRCKPSPHARKSKSHTNNSKIGTKSIPVTQTTTRSSRRHIATTTPTTTSTTATPTTTHTKPHLSLKRKRWAVTWGSSSTNGLCRSTTMDFDPHPQRVILPTFKGEAYSPFTSEFTLIPDIPEEGIADVAQVASGWSTTLVATDEGRVFQWGFRNPTRAMVKRTQQDDRMGRKLGNFFENTIGYHPWSSGSPKPMRIPCFGAETDEQLHQEAERGDVELPEWMTAQRMRPVKISTSADNRGVLTAGGHLFTWSEVGDAHGSIGQGHEYSTSAQPRLINIPDIVDFSFGYNHLSFVTAHGTLYSCGNSDGGATGLPMAFVNLGHKKKRIFRPLSVHTNYEKFVSDLREAVKTHASTTDPVLHKTRENSKFSTNQADLDERAHYNVKMAPKTSKINLEQFTSKERGYVSRTLSPSSSSNQHNDSHEAMRLTGQDLLANVVQFVNWRGVEGKEGAIDPVNLLAGDLMPLTLPKFKAVASGFAHTLAVDEHGSLWSYGRNAHGELGHTLDPLSDEGRGDVKSHKIVNTGLQPVNFQTHYFPVKIKALKDIKVAKVSAGLHHSAILTPTGEVYTFGNNEFGQCGRLNELPSTLRASSVGQKQPWALPPGKLHISPNVLNGAKITDVVCGFYDTALTLSDGRCLMTGGYLSKQGSPRGIFSLAEFDPIFRNDNDTSEDTNGSGDDGSEDPSEEIATNAYDNVHTLPRSQPNTWIQSIHSRDLIPRSFYAKSHATELENVNNGIREQFNLLSDESYSINSIAFGWHHAVAAAVPRTYADAPISAFTTQRLDDPIGGSYTVTHGQSQPPLSSGVDRSLLFSQAAQDHEHIAQEKFKTGAFDASGVEIKAAFDNITKNNSKQHDNTDDHVVENEANNNQKK